MCSSPMRVCDEVFTVRFRSLTDIAIGMAMSKPILEQTLEEYRKQMSVNGKSIRTLAQRKDTTKLT